jgi:hypothetical protein
VFAVSVVLADLMPCLVCAEYLFVTDIWISVFEVFKHCSDVICLGGIHIATGTGDILN